MKKMIMFGLIILIVGIIVVAQISSQDNDITLISQELKDCIENDYHETGYKIISESFRINSTGSTNYWVYFEIANEIYCENGECEPACRDCLPSMSEEEKRHAVETLVIKMIKRLCDRRFTTVDDINPLGAGRNFDGSPMDQGIIDG